MNLVNLNPIPEIEALGKSDKLHISNLVGKVLDEFTHPHTSPRYLDRGFVEYLVEKKLPDLSVPSYKTLVEKQICSYFGVDY